MPLDCDKNILEIPVSGSIPNDTDVIIFTLADGTSVIKTWATIKGAITPNDIEFKVGAGGGAPNDGDTTYTNTALIGKRVRVFRHFIKQPTTDFGGGYYYSFNNVTGTITPAPVFADDEVWQIEIY
ncbi:MAG: hypothetical protein JNK14_05850 [Chitinophagaceae bacterium]|nr:hypothetical protein [Chitinophagaceae bacterium]